jgi:hypothetical protein
VQRLEAMDEPDESDLKDFIVWLVPLSQMERYIAYGNHTVTCVEPIFALGHLHHVTKSGTDNTILTVDPPMCDGERGHKMIMLAVTEVRVGAWATRLHKDTPDRNASRPTLLVAKAR